ncbi:MAG: tetratricopeptide repeat protein [Spirochaetes bacterium]|nr:tetratricopeptide repeat protein [Spirochaetota bacterium]
MSPRRSFLLYAFVLFALGVLLLGWFLLRGMHFGRPFGGSESQARAFSWRLEINNANTFYKNQQYEQALRLLAGFPVDELKPRQRQTVLLLQASAARALGLYATAIEFGDRALRIEATPFGYFLKGLIQEGGGQLDAAAASWQEALRLDGDYAPARERLGDAAFFRKDYRRAMDYYRKGKGPGGAVSEPAVLKRAAAHYLLGEDGETLKLAEWYLEKSKSARDAELAWLLKAIAAAALDRPRDADEAFQKATGLASLGDKHFYKYYYALFLIRQKQYPQAVEMLGQITFIAGERNPAAHFALGLLYFRNQNWEQSLLYLDRNRRFASEQPDLYYYGVALYKLGRLNEALACFELIRARKRADEYSLSATLLAAICQARLGREEQSQSLVDEALDVWRDDVRAVYTLAYITLFHKQKKFMEKLQPWLGRPGYPQLALLLADYHLQDGRTAQALAAVNEYLQKNRPLPRVTKIAGDLYGRLKDFRHAEEAYLDALGLSTDDAEKRRILNNLAWVRWWKPVAPNTLEARTRQAEEARATLEDALRQEPDDPGFLFNSGVFARASGQNDVFADRMEKALAHLDLTQDKKLRSRVRHEKGLLLLEEGRRQAARESLRQALEEDPQNQAAELDFKRLP